MTFGRDGTTNGAKGIFKTPESEEQSDDAPPCVRQIQPIWTTMLGSPRRYHAEGNIALILVE